LQGNFRIGEWRVQPQINCVSKNGSEVHLEPKVMQVLVLLSEHQGEVVSKDRLLQTVWPGVFVGEDVLTRSISEIRRVLADDARSPRFIQTIPKSGYRLIAPVTFDPPAARQAEAELPSVAAQVIQPEPMPPQPVSLETTVTPTRFSLRRAAVVFAVLLLLSFTMFLFWFFRYRTQSRDTAHPYITRPLTSYP